MARGEAGQPAITLEFDPGVPEERYPTVDGECTFQGRHFTQSEWHSLFAAFLHSPELKGGEPLVFRVEMEFAGGHLYARKTYDRTLEIDVGAGSGTVNEETSINLWHEPER